MLQQILAKLINCWPVRFRLPTDQLRPLKIYGIEFHRADSFDDAIQKALEQKFDLIMINGSRPVRRHSKPSSVKI